MDTVYLNGTYKHKQDATISIMDRGFLFGDSIYEVIPAHLGKLVGGPEHFDRMQKSLAAIFIDCPFKDYAELEKICQTLIEKNQLQNCDCAIYFQISRGSEMQRMHRIPTDITPTIVAFCIPAKSYNKKTLQQGFKAITHDDTRRHNNYIKSTTLLTNVLLYEKAREQDCIEAILLRNGNVQECTSSNLFIVKDGKLFTPTLSDYILAGVTRSLIIKFAKDHQIPVAETIVTDSALREADEIWVTGSTKEICPIIQLDNKPVGNGHVGPMWQRFYVLYQQFKEA